MNSKKTTKPLPLDTVESPSIPEETTTEEVTIPETIGGKSRRVSKYGTRRKVWNGTAEKTKGGLRKENLVKNQYGRIVSVKRHTTMKKRHSE